MIDTILEQAQLKDLHEGSNVISRIHNHGIDSTYYPVGYNWMKVRKDFIEIFKIFFKNHKDELFKDYVIWGLVCTGSSGIILASMLAEFLYQNVDNINVRIMNIPKHGENPHSYSFVHYRFTNCGKIRVIVIDDICSSGNTLSKIYEAFDNVFGELRNESILPEKRIEFHSLILSGSEYKKPINFTFKHIYIK